MAKAASAAAAINLAYDSDTDLRLLARSMKAVNVDNSDYRSNNDASSMTMMIEQKRETMVVGGGMDVIDVHQSKSADVISKSSSTKFCESSIDCKCRNCCALSNLTECAVCFESLQSSQIKTCPVCANIVCTRCAARLANCAFCRSPRQPERNRALERLVNKLALPCKNSRSGCKVMLDSERRSAHESMCTYSSIMCPVGRGVCGWCGTVASVQAHLQAAHNLQPLRDHGISVEIFSFRSKAKAADGRVYTVCLACHSQLFVVRIMLYQNRLRLCFTRLGHEQPQPVTQSPKRYGISVMIKSNKGSRRLHGLVPFGEFNRETRELIITCDSLYPKCNDDDHKCCTHAKSDAVNGKKCDRDLVKIDLLVKKIDDYSAELCSSV